ncbi:MAG: efflux RND transporter periplasmic adaptor subunit [Verrucomicrobiota bacterium]
MRLLPVLLLAAAPACRKPQGPERRAPPEVLVVEVARRDVPVYREWLGNLDGWVNAQVRARVAGYLVAQHYKEGARVKAGDLLFQIDPRPLRAALDQARGDLARAEASEKLAALNLQRAAALFEGKVISAQERDTAVANQGTARADVKAQQAAVETAALNLEFAQISAPVEGIAGIANGQVGDLVGPGSPQSDPLTTISTVDPIKAGFTITEQDYIAFASRLAQSAEGREGWELQIVLADGSVYPRKGKLDFANRQVDPATGSMRVTALFPNPGYLLRPGLFCRVRVRTGVLAGALLVPDRAIAEVQGSFQVVVVDSGHKASIRPVEPGERVKGWRVLNRGVRAGETVVVEGLQKVRDGEPVEPKPWQEPPVSPSS